MHTANRATISLDALAALFPHRVCTAAELLGLGLPDAALAARCRPGGPWQHVLPGVLLLSRRPPSRPQLAQAALRHAGPGAQLTGLDALHLHGMRAVPAAGPVRVLSARPAGSTERVRVTRVRELPPPVLRKGFLTAPLPRAAVDAAKTLLPDREAVRAVLTEVVRRGGVRVAELAAGLSRGAEPMRQVLRDLSDGIRTVPQAWARQVLADLPLPPPRWNAQVATPEGVLLGRADVWWEGLGLAWQLSPHPADLLRAVGVVVLRTTPQELRQAPSAVARALDRAAAQARARPCPQAVAITPAPHPAPHLMAEPVPHSARHPAPHPARPLTAEPAPHSVPHPAPHAARYPARHPTGEPAPRSALHPARRPGPHLTAEPTAGSGSRSWKSVSESAIASAAGAGAGLGASAGAQSVVEANAATGSRSVVRAGTGSRSVAGAGAGSRLGAGVGSPCAGKAARGTGSRPSAAPSAAPPREVIPPPDLPAQLAPS
ncbi:hypothetical protein [Saccharothrix algeriensis]|uniref:AbiEi antitoxin C-terminal domain-containing protein n=2 Tax=Saccharothrix algeriensis TaxID=173560 RepID=A0ABS2SCK1_9PSEU|nr:hypothetical protein [Saccharothrix algeriensis]MBM7813535.1 hypothetical protein [Saccharothrix algeriensis]